MVPDLSVDNFKVRFAAGWIVSKFDDWIFYNQHFLKIRDGLKAVDVIAVCPERIAYLIEFKDYRGRKREKSETIESEFIGKILSTLASLLPAQCNARIDQEQQAARRALRATKIKLVLHIDQGEPGNKLFPPVVTAAALTQNLRRKLRSIDPHLKVCSSETMETVPWKIA